MYNSVSSVLFHVLGNNKTRAAVLRKRVAPLGIEVRLLGGDELSTGLLAHVRIFDVVRVNLDWPVRKGRAQRIGEGPLRRGWRLDHGRHASIVTRPRSSAVGALRRGD